MASPQAENGHTDIANEIMDVFCKSFPGDTEGQVLLAILRKTYGWHKKEDSISIGQLVEMTGKSRRMVIYALQNLEAKKMVSIVRKRGRGIKNEMNKISFQKNYDLWLVQEISVGYRKSLNRRKELYKKYTQLSSARNVSSARNGNLVVQEYCTHKRKNYKRKETTLTSSAKTEDSPFVSNLEITPPLLPPPIEPKKECPHGEIISLYHSILPELNPVKVWNEFRKKTLQSRWRESPERRDLKWWESFFRRIRESDFLMGRARDFRADLEWLIRPKNFAAVLEGRYHRPGTSPPRQFEKTKYSGDCIDGAWEFIDGLPNQIYVMKKGEREIKERTKQDGKNPTEKRIEN